MVKAKYESMEAKLANLAEKHELIYVWDTNSRYITLTIKPQAVEAEQTSFIEDKEDEKSSSDAAINLIFKDGEITINTIGKLFITEALMNKFKNVAKKMHYLYLQVMRDERFTLPELDDNAEAEYDEEDDE